MALKIKWPKSDSNELARHEWDLRKLQIPEWQWVMMLNYEFARCSKLIIDGVKQCRKIGAKPSGNIGKVSAFARFLAKNYPEFPKSAWSQIPGDQRESRLEQMGRVFPS